MRTESQAIDRNGSISNNQVEKTTQSNYKLPESIVLVMNLPGGSYSRVTYTKARIKQMIEDAKGTDFAKNQKLMKIYQKFNLEEKINVHFRSIANDLGSFSWKKEEIY